MTNKEIIEKYWEVENILICQHAAYLIIDNDKAIGLNGYIKKDSFTIYLSEEDINPEFKIMSVWHLGETPGLGIDIILRDLHKRYTIKNTPELEITKGNAYKIWDKRAELPFEKCKVFVGTKSKDIQEKLFILGYRWIVDGATIKYLDEPFLFLNPDGILSYIHDYMYFYKHDYKEITIQDILNK